MTPLFAFAEKALADPAVSFQPGNPASAGIESWQTLLVGGGGYVTGIDISPDGTKLARSDTPPSLYVWSKSANRWLPLVLSTSMPNAFVSPRSDKCVGCWEARICPSLTTKFYMVLAGAVFVTSNSGGTWMHLTNFTANISDADSNNGFRIYGYRMAVDPQNDAICYIGTPSAGLQVTFDGGSSWSTVSGVTASSVGGILVAFDPTSSVSDGKKQGIFAASWGQGVWRSTNGGSSWTKLSTGSMPFYFARMIVDQNGKLWVCSLDPNQNCNGVYTWTSRNGWALNSVSTQQSFAVAVDPANANNVVVVGPGGRMFQSNDGGNTWPLDTLHKPFTADGTGDAVWIGTPWRFPGGAWFVSSGGVVFDPSQSNVCYGAFGYGIWHYPVNAAAKSVTTVTQMRGIEGLDANVIIHPPGGSIIGGAYDLKVWPGLSTSAYAKRYAPDFLYGGPQPSRGAHRCWSLDWAKSSPSTIVQAGGGGNSAYSSNGGDTWTAFADQTPFANGDNGACIAASTAGNFVGFATGTGVYYTTDAGAKWSVSAFAGSTAIAGKLLCADIAANGTFYLYSPRAAVPASSGVYKSTDSGATFSRVSNFTFPNEGFNCTIKCVPNNSSHLFGTGGFLDTGTPPIANDFFYWSTNGGTTWKKIPNWTEVMAFGFGTVVPGQSYPTIYAAGWFNRVFGVYKCTNFNPTTGFSAWTLLGGQSYPQGWYAPITDLAGDPSLDGACSISFANGGFKRFA